MKCSPAGLKTHACDVFHLPFKTGHLVHGLLNRELACRFTSYITFYEKPICIIYYIHLLSVTDSKKLPHRNLKYDVIDLKEKILQRAPYFLSAARAILATLMFPKYFVNTSPLLENL